MGEIPGWPSLTVTDEHKQQAAALLKSIKDANPQHASVFKKLEDGAVSVADVVSGGVADVGLAVGLPILILMALASGRPIFGD